VACKRLFDELRIRTVERRFSNPDDIQFIVGALVQHMPVNHMWQFNQSTFFDKLINRDWFCGLVDAKYRTVCPKHLILMNRSLFA
jgi:hypothetical protein